MSKTTEYLTTEHNATSEWEKCCEACEVSGELTFLVACILLLQAGTVTVFERDEKFYLELLEKKKSTSGNLHAIGSTRQPRETKPVDVADSTEIANWLQKLAKSQRLRALEKYKQDRDR